jgi:phospholipase C
MIEWRWNLAPMTARDRNARNLAEALTFSARQAPVKLPAFKAPPDQTCTSDQTQMHVAS